MALGLPSGTVRVVEYDHAWPLMFTREVDRIRGFLGEMALELEHRGEQGIQGRHFFRRGDPRSYHLHLAVRGGNFWRDHLVFRDALRGDPRLREEYAALKRGLAERYPFDRESYIEGKTWFIDHVLRRAG